jgi:hypothetical protein
VLEIISPAGFEMYFEELAAALSATTPPDPARIQEIAARYGLTLHLDQMPEILERYHLRLPEPA